MTSQFFSSVSSHTISTQSIVFIDATVSDRQTLINSVAPGTTVVMLDETRNGIEQITETLAHVDSVESLHIVSHGAPGCLFLGNTLLSLKTLPLHAPQIQDWNSALSDHASILLYGCNVAAGDAGSEFVEALHALTHANIGASQTLTGHAALGGNWQLEVTTGAIAPLAFDAAALAEYEWVLENVTSGGATWEVIGTNAPTANSGRIISSTKAGQKGLDNQFLSIGGVELDGDVTQTGNVVRVTQNLAGLGVTVEYRAFGDVLRTFVTLTNSGGSEITTPLKLAVDPAGGGIDVLQTSSGNLLLDTGDRFVIADTLNPSGLVDDAVNALAYFGGTPQTAQTIGNNSFETSYEAIVAAGASKSFIFFNAFRADKTQVASDAATFTDFASLGNNNLLTGLTSTQLKQVEGFKGGIKITPLSGTTTEAGGKATFSVELTSGIAPDPGSPVTVTLANSDLTEGSLDKTSLTFTSDNFAKAQVITATGVDDTLADGNIQYSITATATAAAGSIYNGLAPISLSLTNTDNETASTPGKPNLITGSPIIGTSKKDVLIGTDANDLILGKGGNDKLFGSGGNDTLRGGLGKDKLVGGVGADILNGDRGKDNLFGGGGSDVFVISRKKGADVIRDYKDGQDKIDLKGSLTFGSLTLTQKGKDTVFSSGSEVLATLKGATKGQFSAADFS
jgi:Ca2+-binding RTX toxin-like protein